MSTEYTILRLDRRINGAIYHVLADDQTGFDKFIIDHGEKVLPGSTIDVADYKTVFRMRNDKTWENYRSYAADDEEQATIEEAAVAALMDELIPDEDIEESEATE